MNTISQIEKANYLATTEDVERMAREQFDASQLQGRTNTTYFRILLASVQQALVGKPVLRAGRGQLAALDSVKHLEAFEEVNSRLYAAVIRGTVTPDIEPVDGLSDAETQRRSQERNRRNNFARTAASAMRRYIKNGGDVRRVPVPTATKNSIVVANASTGVTDEERSRQRVKRAASRLAAVVEELAGADKKLAVEALQDSMSSVTALLARLAGKPTDKPAIAILDHRLFRTPEGVFWPVTPATPEVRTQ